MKPSMMRWKIVPLYRGSVVFSRVAGWVHSRRPSARSAKFATVFGAWSGNRSMAMSPWLVCSTARRAGEFDSVTPPLCHDPRARSDPAGAGRAQDAGEYSSRLGDRFPATFTTPVVAVLTRFDATADGDSGLPGLRDRRTAAAP